MLSITRQQQLIRSLNTQGQKVFDSVPINEAWSLHKIINEIVRRGISMDKASIHGSISHMLKVGLVYEPEHHHYQRMGLRPLRTKAEKTDHKPEEGTAMQEAMTRATLTTVKAVDKMSTIDALAHVAADLRAQAKDMEAAADRLDELALQIAEDQQAGSKELEDIKRIRAAMKTLMGEG